jgi:hypothetical protein
MPDREIDIEVTEDNRDALEGIHEVMSRTSDAALMGQDEQ